MFTLDASSLSIELENVIKRKVYTCEISLLH